MRLPAQIPFAIAMEIILTGDPISARRAYEVGLINDLVPSSAELMPAAERMAERILACSPVSVKLSKEQVLRGFNLPIHTQLAVTQIGKEADGSEDAKPPMSAHKRALREVHKKVGGPLPPGRPGKFGSPQRGTPKKGYRLDPGHPGRPYPESGPHINWWNYTGGKRAPGRSGAEPIK